MLSFPAIKICILDLNIKVVGYAQNETYQVTQ